MKKKLNPTQIPASDSDKPFNLDKWSIQISTHLAQYLKTWCKERGYTMSGFVEGAIIQRLSGSYEKHLA